jgi:glycerol 2-dehydrogenase (NADP+)
VYATEELIGDAIRASGVPRSEITVVTKLPNECHHDPHAAFHESLRRLDIGYIDIYIMHWPCAVTPDGKRPLSIEESPTFIETYKMMESLVGPKCRSLGVSNFTQKTLDALLQEAKIKPVVNQIEVHPLNPNLKLIPYCQERQIQVMAWG